MTLSNRIAEIVRDSLANSGYELIEVNISSNKNKIIDIFIDCFDGKPVSIEDCVVASRLISAILDVEDPIEGKYHLNVSSPGEYRSITSITDFKRFCGREAKLELYSPINGKRKICGILSNVQQNLNDVVVYLKEECNTSDAVSEIVFSNIKKAIIKRIF